jgi:HlyD family secretion protein
MCVRKKAIISLPIIGLCLLALSACEPMQGIGMPITGQIQGNGVDVGSRVGGRVAEVPVREGDTVQAGDVLLRLEDADAQALVQAAEADLARAESLVSKLDTGATEEQLRQAESAAKTAEERLRMVENGARDEDLRAAKAAADAAASQSANTKADFERMDKLFARGAVSKSEYDRVRTAMDTMSAQHRVAKERLDALTNGARVEEVAMAKSDFERAKAALDEVKRGPRDEDKAAAKAARDAAAAAVERARVNLREMTVVAPSKGVVESLDLRPGDLVKPGAVARIIDPDDLKVTVYMGAALLGSIKLGQKIPLTADAHGSERFEGEVYFIATEGEYTPRNLQTQEERVQQVFGVKLRLDSNGGKLRAGMTVTAHVPGGREK